MIEFLKLHWYIPLVCSYSDGGGGGDGGGDDGGGDGGGAADGAGADGAGADGAGADGAGGGGADGTDGGTAGGADVFEGGVGGAAPEAPEPESNFDSFGKDTTIPDPMVPDVAAQAMASAIPDPGLPEANWDAMTPDPTIPEPDIPEPDKEKEDVPEPDKEFGTFTRDLAPNQTIEMMGREILGRDQIYDPFGTRADYTKDQSQVPQGIPGIDFQRESPFEKEQQASQSPFDIGAPPLEMVGAPQLEQMGQMSQQNFDTQSMANALNLDIQEMQSAQQAQAQAQAQKDDRDAITAAMLEQRDYMSQPQSTNVVTTTPFSAPQAQQVAQGKQDLANQPPQAPTFEARVGNPNFNATVLDYQNLSGIPSAPPPGWEQQAQQTGPFEQQTGFNQYGFSALQQEIQTSQAQNLDQQEREMQGQFAPQSNPLFDPTPTAQMAPTLATAPVASREQMAFEREKEQPSPFSLTPSQQAQLAALTGQQQFTPAQIDQMNRDIAFNPNAMQPYAPPPGMQQQQAPPAPVFGPTPEQLAAVQGQREQEQWEREGRSLQAPTAPLQEIPTVAQPKDPSPFLSGSKEERDLARSTAQPVIPGNPSITISGPALPGSTPSGPPSGPVELAGGPPKEQGGPPPEPQTPEEAVAAGLPDPGVYEGGGGGGPLTPRSVVTLPQDLKDANDPEKKPLPPPPFGSTDFSEFGPGNPLLSPEQRAEEVRLLQENYLRRKAMRDQIAAKLTGVVF